MAVLVRGLWRAVFEMNVVCIFLHMEPRDNKGKKYSTCTVTVQNELQQGRLREEIANSKEQIK